jgi:Tfp pilus assembly protein PilF
LDTRAMVYLALGQGRLALKDLELAIADGPTAPMYWHLACAYQCTGDRLAMTNPLRKAEALGLKADLLHPLERPKFLALRAELQDR